ncbi:Methyl-accepting chemotaxis protein McpA [Fundidesulfovibrio magnetotacticus]|uniref:Methyl-accepting chemotaxis protein McpA n=1 Tax=Fundidesulfovibrio magnetotacticus TaxID=2730080 RepID=A0A6V8LQ20_9BACT|nr:methyl-accepting chemotaxis protein [Fundidesulfovibrio magnetotacticus]GFK94623.1 Methyl-accepting chemotaxis protein McpA [Fundidesulfovibrio magnetotacticus]
MNLSIKTKLIAGMLLVIALVFAVIFKVVAANVSTESSEAFIQSASRELAHVDYAVTLFLDESRLNADALARSPLAARIDEVTSTFVGTSAPRKSTVDPDDPVGKEVVALFDAVQRAHPAYVEVFMGNRNGGFVSALQDSEMPTGYDPRKRPWYQEALPVKDRPSMSKAYMSTTKEAVTSVTRTVLRGQEVIGVIGIDISLKKLTDLVGSIKLGRTGYLVLVQDDGVVLADPRHPAFNFKKVGEAAPYLAELFKLTSGHQDVSVDGKPCLGVTVTSPKTGWKLLGIIEREEIMAPARAAEANLAVTGGAGLLAIAVVVWLFSTRVIIAPLRQVSGFLAAIAKGDYAHRASHQRTDEIGGILDVLNATAGKLEANMLEIRAKTQEAEQKARDAEAATREAEDARCRAEAARSEGMLQAAGKLERIVEGLGGASSQLEQRIEDSSRGAREQAGRAADTANSMEQMTSTVLDVARNASQAASTADQARSKAQEGSGAVDRVLAGMHEVQGQSERLKDDMRQLGAQAEDIGRVLTVISDIADQTNLLALNAAIEAARAGDAGRGFAVVADEVRKLAEKTMTATREVGDAIGAIQQSARRNVENVERSVTLIGEAARLADGSGRTLEEIVKLVESASDQVRAIAAASEEQSAASEEISRSVEEVNSVSAHTSQAMAEASKAVSDLAGQAQALQALIDSLQDEARGGPGSCPPALGPGRS